MFRAIPQLRVTDLARSVAFYTGVLGFSVGTLDPPAFATVQREEAELFLETRVAGDRIREAGQRSVRIYFEVDDAQALYDQLAQSDVEVIKEPTANPAENYVEFVVSDPDGHELGFYS